jgi:hypothetical protein
MGPSAITADIIFAASERDENDGNAAENPPDDADDSVLPARGRVLKPCGRPCNKNA